MLNRLFLITLVGALFSSAAAEAQTGINWVDSVDAAKAQAAQSQRLVLLHFYSDDCGPCRRLDARVFPTAAVQQAIARGYVPAKINTSKDPQTAKLYNVYTWPTDIVVDSRGRELYRTISPQDANQYTQMLNATVASHQATMPYNAQIDRNPLNALANQAPGVAAGATNAGLYGQAASEQLRQTQQYAQHVAQQYQNDASQNLYGQAQQTAQAATQGVQNQFAQAQQSAQLYGQNSQNAVQQTANAAQSQIAAAQQTAAQYGQNLGLYGQQATQSVADQAAGASQAVQQSAQTLNQYGQQAMQSANSYAANAQQAAAQAAENGLYGQQQQQPASQAPYSPAYDPTQNARPQLSQNNPPIQAPPYGQMTQNPYVTQGATTPPVAPTTPTNPVANNVGNPAVQPTNPPTANPAIAGAAGPTTAPYGELYANNAGQGATSPTTPPVQPTQSTQQTTPPTPPIGPAPAYEPNKPRPVGMDGYCPVTLLSTKKWAKGDVRYGAVHRSRTYLFVSEAAQQLFMADPDRYAPMLSGYDAVAYRKTGRLVEGSRAHGLTFMNQMFLFESEESLNEFAKSPQVFLGAVQQAMQATPQRTVR